MNRPLRRMSAVLMLLFALLMLNVNYLQAVRAGSLNERKGNTRILLQEYSRERGAIYVGSTKVASSKPTNDELKYLRQYPAGPTYAQVTGFYSSVYGATGIERTANRLLAGTDDRLFIRRAIDIISGHDSPGASVSLTINPAAQQAAYDGLRNGAGDGPFRGAVVAIEPRTGAILALVSSPSFDPNVLSVHSSKAATAAYQKLIGTDSQPMLDRALSRTYPPGSTFKLITAAAALRAGQTPATETAGPARITLPGTKTSLPNESGQQCKDGTPTLSESLEVSCNTAFAQIGLDVGAAALRRQAEDFGFDDTSLRVPLPVAASRFPTDPDNAQTALSAIGQFDVAATPLQMAMVAAAIADQGRLMTPYLVDRILAPDLTVIETAESSQLRQSVTPDVAANLRDMMVNVVQNGTGKPARIDGVQVAGKTGTAQQGEGKPPHAWFVSFAPADAPQVAVAVVVEDGGAQDDVSGGRLAAPIAKAVMTAVLAHP